MMMKMARKRLDENIFKTFYSEMKYDYIFKFCEMKNEEDITTNLYKNSFSFASI